MGDTGLPVLGFRQKICYGVGHVLNDLCASMWFSYLLLYFQGVVRFHNVLAGYLMLLGQVADALCTPFIGYESDRTNGICGYGKRKSWHMIGSLCVLVSFPFLFLLCIHCGNSLEWAKFLYYAPFVVIFQFGWAATQISHLSLIPELTPCQSERVELNAIRYSFTVISNIAVYCIMWGLLSKNIGTSPDIEPSDASQFRTLMLIVIGIGAVFTVLFHVGTRETSQRTPHVDPDADPAKPCQPKAVLAQLTWRGWLKKPRFYQMALVYMCTRLIVNLTQIYLPMYINHSLMLVKHYVAVIPLVVFVSGFFVSFLMKPLNSLFGRKMTYLLGAVLVGGSCIWMWFLDASTSKFVFGPAVLLGFGTSTILVTSLAMTADLIGANTNSGAFVYGAMSFTDKLSNGVAVVAIQIFHPCNSSQQVCCPACVWFYRDTMVFIPGAVVVVAMVAVLLGSCRRRGGEEARHLLGDEGGAGHRASYDEIRSVVTSPTTSESENDRPE